MNDPLRHPKIPVNVRLGLNGAKSLELTGAGSTKSPRGKGTLTITVYTGSGTSCDAIVNRWFAGLVSEPSCSGQITTKATLAFDDRWRLVVAETKGASATGKR